jgi:hypothetical protein
MLSHYDLLLCRRNGRSTERSDEDQFISFCFGKCHFRPCRWKVQAYSLQRLETYEALASELKTLMTLPQSDENFNERTFPYIN